MGGHGSLVGGHGRSVGGHGSLVGGQLKPGANGRATCAVWVAAFQQPLSPNFGNQNSAINGLMDWNLERNGRKLRNLEADKKISYKLILNSD